MLFTRDIDKSGLKLGDNIEVLFRNEKQKYQLERKYYWCYDRLLLII